MALAVTHFQGGTGDWGDDANWSLVEPVSNQTAIIDAGTVNVSAGLDNTAVDLDLLWISPGYSGDIGSSGGRLIIAADLIVHLGSGELWLYAEDNSAGLSIDRVVVCAANPSTIVNIDGDAGALDHVQVLRGSVTLPERPNTLLEVGYKTNRASDANVTLPASAGTTAEVMQDGGTLTSDDVITLFNFYGGRCTHGTGAITTLNAMGPGAIVYNSTSTLVTARVGNGATLDLMQNHEQKTITTLWEMPGGRALFDTFIADTANHSMHTITTHHDLTRLGR